MAHLETRLGVKLCERGRSGFRLTEQGEAIYEATQRLLGAVEDFCVDADVLKRQVSGTLKFGVIDSTITDPGCPLKQTTQRFVQRGHEVHLHVYIGTPAELEEKVLDGRLHLAIGHFPFRVPGLSYSPLYQESHGFFCGRNHGLFSAEGPKVNLLERIAVSRVVARGYLQQRDLQALGVEKAAATVDNVEAQAMLILSGAYAGFLPEHYARQWVDSGDLKHLEPGRLRLLSTFEIITRRGVTPPLILRAFLDELMQSTRALT
jgi:DNA-binding transcriptional LysR family regulator